MRNKLCALLLVGVLLGLSGCSLAQPVGEGGDRWLGYFVALNDENHTVNGVDQEGWIKYGGGEQVRTEFGSFNIPQRVLVAQADGDDYTFPGLEGGKFFYVHSEDENGNRIHTVQSDLSDGQYHVTETDEGTQIELSGTFYYGLPEGWTDWERWHENKVSWCLELCEVWQMADGTVYLKDSGPSVGPGGGMTYTRTQEYIRTEEDGSFTDSLKVSVSFTEISRLERLTVRQYGADGTLLESEDLPVDGGGLAVKWLPGAAWAAVEEVRAGAVERTVYDRSDVEEQRLGHTVILLDENGLGRAAWVEFE